MDALKPCPKSWCVQSEPPYLTTWGGSKVVCGHCGLETPVYDTEAEAIAAWNERPETERLVEALRECADKLWVLRCNSRDSKDREAAEKAVCMATNTLSSLKGTDNG